MKHDSSIPVYNSRVYSINQRLKLSTSRVQTWTLTNAFATNVIATNVIANTYLQTRSLYCKYKTPVPFSMGTNLPKTKKTQKEKLKSVASRARDCC